MQKTMTINDLREIEESGKDMSPQQRLALKNFDRYKFKVLSKIKEEEKFHFEFQQIQNMAKLRNYEDFLKEEFL